MAYDPRTSPRYQRARAAYLAAYQGDCALCGQPVDTALPHGLPRSPTIEHRYAIRHILANVSTRAEAVDMACDTSLWALAHSACQSRQGASVTNGTPKRRIASREW